MTCNCNHYLAKQWKISCPEPCGTSTKGLLCATKCPKPPKNSKSNHLIENLMSFCLMRQYYWAVYLWLRVEVKKGPAWTDVEMRVGGFYLVNWRHSQAGFVVVTQNQQLRFVLFFSPLEKSHYHAINIIIQLHKQTGLLPLLRCKMKSLINWSEQVRGN